MTVDSSLLEKPATPTLFEGRRWLNYREAGVLLGISGDAVRMMVRRGHLPYTFIGKRIFIDRLDLERLLERNKVKLS